MKKLIPERKVSIPSLCSYLASEGISHSRDGDGDIYVSDKEMGFPFWMTIDRPNRVIIMFSFTEYETIEKALEALDAAQRIRLGPLTPQFFLQDAALYAHYFISYRDGVITTHIFDAACRFTEFFHHTAPNSKPRAGLRAALH